MLIAHPLGLTGFSPDGSEKGTTRRADIIIKEFTYANKQKQNIGRQKPARSDQVAGERAIVKGDSVALATAPGAVGGAGEAGVPQNLSGLSPSESHHLVYEGPQSSCCGEQLRRARSRVMARRS